MLTVACVLRSGGVYTPTWVARLRAGVARHLPAEYRFVCLSDADVACERIALHHEWPGWWSKLELFALRGPVLYFDLDTLIIGDLSDIARAAVAAEFTVLRDFYRPERLGSGVMAWSGGVRELYSRFMLAPGKYMARHAAGGDQEYIAESIVMGFETLWQDAVPGQIVSYKADRCEAGPPPGARVVCLHGKPKFPDMPPYSWARQAWEALA